MNLILKVLFSLFKQKIFYFILQKKFMFFDDNIQ